jgi:hypothetical protein
MKIVTVVGLIGTLELMRQYQKEGTVLPSNRIQAEEWERVVDEYIPAWKQDGINGSVPLFGDKGEKE